MTGYVDTHCHLDLLVNPAEALDAAPGVVVVAVTELPSRFRLLKARFRGDRRVRVALGLHPLRAASAGPIEEGLLLRQLPESDYVGEIGLDFSPHGRDSRRDQLRVLDRLLAETELQRKVVTAHSRGAERVLIARLQDAGVPAVLHWYTGPLALVEEALAAGMYFSINPAMASTVKGRTLIAALPPERALTETDAPFAKSGSRTLEPRDITLAVAALARIWGASADDVRDLVHANLTRLYATRVRGNRDDAEPA